MLDRRQTDHVSHRWPRPLPFIARDARKEKTDVNNNRLTANFQN